MYIRYSSIVGATLLMMACGGTGPGESQVEALAEAECIGQVEDNPRCEARSDLWSCASTPEGDKKCMRKPMPAPRDLNGLVSCGHDGEHVVCEVVAPASLDAAWACAASGASNSQCVSLGKLLAAPGTGAWKCELELEHRELKLECEQRAGEHELEVELVLKTEDEGHEHEGDRHGENRGPGGGKTDGDDNGMDDPATHDVGDDNGMDDPATHDVGDDNGMDTSGETELRRRFQRETAG